MSVPTWSVKAWALAALGIGAFATMRLVTMISPMLPTLAEAFHRDVGFAHGVVREYSLTMANSRVLFGRLGDLLGRKLVLVTRRVELALSSILFGSVRTIVPFRGMSQKPSH